MGKQGKKKRLLIVESPTKARTLQRYIKGLEVLASMGHVKDLPKSDFGVDLETFEPTYTVLRGKGKVLQAIKKAALQADEIFLGTDPDREGEAIAYHIAEEIQRKAPKKPIRRVLFFEITPDAVREALRSPQNLDMNKVEAQKARRILDRIVGYQISPILWRILRQNNLSAGRVQTVALRLICEREEEIQKFVPRTYYVLRVVFEKDGTRFEGFLRGVKGEISSRNLQLSSLEEAQALIKTLEGRLGEVVAYKQQIHKIPPPPPYKTSTLQQDAANRLGFSASRTMQIAQRLYEGVTIQGKTQGLITYMRTDSVRLSEKALKAIRHWIKERVGAEYLPKRARQHTDKGPLVQGAHEAIRPTRVDLDPDTAGRDLPSDEGKLYNLVWRRAVASQMKAAEIDKRQAVVQVGEALFVAEGQSVHFDGFFKIYGDPPEEKMLPPLKEGDRIRVVDIEILERTTQPPARYTEATLVQTLEKVGVGRPSTYAPTLQTLFTRGYVERVGRALKPTDLGMTVYRLLVPRFPHLFEVGFTAKMEEALDRIEMGEEDRKGLLSRFYKDFEENLHKVIENLDEMRDSLRETLDETCPECGAPLVVRWGKYGRFVSCSRYPTCTYTRNLTSGLPCPACEEGELVERQNRKTRRTFWGCNRYPACTYTLRGTPTHQPCQTCGYPSLFRFGRKTFCPRCSHREPKKKHHKTQDKPGGSS